MSARRIRRRERPVPRRAPVRILPRWPASEVADRGRGQDRPVAWVRGGRAIGIVKVENRRLGQEGAGTAMGRVGGVSLHFGRPALMGLRQQGNRPPAQGHCRRVVERESGDDALDRLAERQDIALRPAQAPASPTPPRANEAAMIFRKWRRSTPSRDEAPSGNSRSSWALNPGVAASSSRLRQYRGPLSSRLDAGGWTILRFIDGSRSRFAGDSRSSRAQTSFPYRAGLPRWRRARRDW